MIGIFGSLLPVRDCHALHLSLLIDEEHEQGGTDRNTRSQVRS